MGNVDFKFTVETFADLTTSNELPFLARKWRVVYHEFEFDGWLFHIDCVHWLFRSIKEEGFADGDVRETCNHRDVAGLYIFCFDTSSALESENLCDFSCASFTSWRLDSIGTANFERAVVHTNSSKASHELVVAEVENLRPPCCRCIT